MDDAIQKLDPIYMVLVWALRELGPAIKWWFSRKDKSDADKLIERTHERLNGVKETLVSGQETLRQVHDDLQKERNGVSAMWENLFNSERDGS